MEVWNRLSNPSPSSPSRSVTNANFHLLFDQCQASQRHAHALPSVNKYSGNAADAPVGILRSQPPPRNDRMDFGLVPVLSPAGG
jgi:hypothetical protein